MLHIICVWIKLEWKTWLDWIEFIGNDRWVRKTTWYCCEKSYIYNSFFLCVTRNSVFHRVPHTGKELLQTIRTTTNTLVLDFTCMIRNGTKHTGTLFALAQTAMAPAASWISRTRACKNASSARQTIVLFCSGEFLTSKVVFIMAKIITQSLKHTFPSYPLTLATSTRSSTFPFEFLNNKKSFRSWFNLYPGYGLS